MIVEASVCGFLSQADELAVAAKDKTRLRYRLKDVRDHPQEVESALAVVDPAHEEDGGRPFEVRTMGNPRKLDGIE